jgi:hypothetical protein
VLIQKFLWPPQQSTWQWFSSKRKALRERTVDLTQHLAGHTYIQEEDRPQSPVKGSLETWCSATLWKCSDPLSMCRAFQSITRRMDISMWRSSWGAGQHRAEQPLDKQAGAVSHDAASHGIHLWEHTHTHTHKIYNARYTMRPPQVCQPEPITTVILAQTAKCRHTWRTWYWWWDTRAVRCGRVARGTGASRRGPQSFTRNGDGPAIQYVQFMKLRPCCHDHWPMRPSSGHKAAACTSAASRLVRAVSQGGAIKAH